MGRWDGWYRGVVEAEPYGGDLTYQLGAEWLDGMAVEDWGCGKGWMRRFVPAGLYRGIDGSWSPHADEVVDLESYRSDVDGIFMRHVLEHCFGWPLVLENALRSFRRRMALVLFTPFGEVTREIGFCEEVGVPDISFRREDLTGQLDGAGVDWSLREALPSDTYYGVEHVFFIERARHGPSAHVATDGPV
jgi:hypothetical protein